MAWFRRRAARVRFAPAGARNSGFYRARLALRSGALAVLGQQSASRRGEIRALRRNWRTNRGALIMPPEPASQVEAEPENNPRTNPLLFPPAWRCDPVNGAYVLRFLKLTADRRLPVYLLIPPFSPGVQSGRERVGADAAFTRFARSLQARFPSLTVLDGRRLGLDHRAFLDGVHLDRRGASVLSAALADVLADHLDGKDRRPRWVDLRPTPGAPRPETAVDLEDLERSRLAVGAPRSVRLRSSPRPRTEREEPDGERGRGEPGAVAGLRLELAPPIASLPNAARPPR
jgi:hypothetical protein